MEKIKRVVIPIDDTIASKIAAEQGAYFAKLLNVSVSLVSVNEANQYMLSALLENKMNKEKQILLNDLKEIAENQGITATTELRSGSPAEEIVKYTNEDDLIIMASHGREGFNKFLLGSVSEEVLHSAPCSVMIIRPKNRTNHKNHQKK